MLSNCGCDARRQIMFTDGRPGVPEMAIVGAVIIAAFVAWRINR